MIKFIALILYLVVFLLFRVDNHILAQSAPEDSAVNATVRISICGNNIIEGVEDCEGGDLNGQTCETQGYGGGELVCDIACSFDYSDCLPPTPTPTPSPTPTPTATPTASPTTTPTPTPPASPAPTPTPTPTPGPAQEILESLVDTITQTYLTITDTIDSALPKISPPPVATDTPMPTAVLPFDLDGSGIIETHEIQLAVEMWVADWRQAAELLANFGPDDTFSDSYQSAVAELNCDLNQDLQCDLQDFSILMYYIQS